MVKYKHLILLLVLTILSSCSIGGINPQDTDDMASNDKPYYIYIKYKIKKMDYSGYGNTIPWDYIDDTRCGWRYDGWMNDLDYNKPDICIYVCETRPKTDFRNDLFPTLERCLYFDYKGL